MRLDARDVAEPRHELPTEVRTIPAADLEPEDLDRAPLAWRVDGPGVLVLGAVEVVAPERLLVASPAQPPLVGGAVNGDAAIEEARDLGRDRGRGCRGGFDVLLRCGVANDEGEGEEDKRADERPAGDRGSRHGQLSRIGSRRNVLYLTK